MRWQARGRGAAAGLVLLVLLSSPVAAQNGYRVDGTGGAGLRVRSGPGVGYERVGWLAEDTPIDIACQGTGSSVGGSTIWDQLSAGGWVSDYYVYGTPYARFDERLPRCGETQPTREDNAVNWARSQLGSTAWNGLCDRFVANAYGKARSGYATAAAHYRDLQQRGLVHSDSNIPYGALAFSAGNSAAGHVMLSLGGGRFITTAERVKEVSLSYGGTYWGWSWANPEWPGR